MTTEQREQLEKLLAIHNHRTELLDYYDATKLIDLQQIAEREGREAIIAKLPKTRDGVPIVPGMLLWIFDSLDQGVHYGPAISIHASGMISVATHGDFHCTDTCSTKDAASAARVRERLTASPERRGT